MQSFIHTMGSEHHNTSGPPERDSRLGQVEESYLGVINNISSSLLSAFRWCPTSESLLEQAEKDLLSVITIPFKTYFLDIGPAWSKPKVTIRTLETLRPRAQEGNTQTNFTLEKNPLLLLHGFASGIGTWILNYDKLYETIDRKIYAIDILGFGRSARIPFDLKNDVDGQFVDSVERWRTKQGIEKFILLGHSFGGYVAANYALKYPQRVSHLILADPWGVQDRESAANRRTFRFPIWVRLANSLFQAFNPLTAIRFTGPYGPKLVHKFRGDLREKFRPVLHDGCEKFLNYIYHCNARKPTGEAAFKSITLPFGWPKNPLIQRLLDLDESVSMTFIYGSRSWIEKTPGEFLQGCMVPNRVMVHEILGSGHHVYADKYDEFNNLVQEACNKIKE